MSGEDGHVKKIVGLVVVWALVTGVGIVVTSAAVGDVRGSVTDTVAAGFYIEGTGQAERATVASSIPPSDATAPDETVGGPSLDGASASSSTTSEGTSTTTTTADASSSAITTSTTKAPAVTTTTTSTTAAPTTIRTYNSIGGSVTVEVGDGTLTLLGAVPNSGFTAEEEERSDPTKVVVEFKSSSHHSSIEVKFDSGQVVSEIEEEPQG